MLVVWNSRAADSEKSGGNKFTAKLPSTPLPLQEGGTRPHCLPRQLPPPQFPRCYVGPRYQKSSSRSRS